MHTASALVLCAHKSATSWVVCHLFTIARYSDDYVVLMFTWYNYSIVQIVVHRLECNVNVKKTSYPRLSLISCRGIRKEREPLVSKLAIHSIIIRMSMSYRPTSHVCFTPELLLCAHQATSVRYLNQILHSTSDSAQNLISWSNKITWENVDTKLSPLTSPGTKLHCILRVKWPHLPAIFIHNVISLVAMEISRPLLINGVTH